MKHLTNSEDAFTLRSALAWSADQQQRNDLLRIELDKPRAAELVAFEVGNTPLIHDGHTYVLDESGKVETVTPPVFSERALDRIVRDVVQHTEDPDHGDEVRAASAADMKVYDRIADGYKPAESMLPAHAVAVPHDRPVMWVTRRDLAFSPDLSKWSESTIQFVVGYYRDRFNAYTGDLGSVLADYLPEVI